MRQVVLQYTVLLWAIRQRRDVLLLQQLKSVAKYRRSKLKLRKVQTAAHSTPWTGWSTSRKDSTAPGAAAIGRLSWWPVLCTARIRRVVNVNSRMCRTEGCSKYSSYGVVGTKTAEYCAQHAQDGMVDVRSSKCRTEGCGKQPSFGVAGTKTARYCVQHAPNEMVNVKTKRKCRTEGCGKRPSFGVAVTKTAEYCAQHAPDGMVAVTSIKCRTEGCGKWPSFGVAVYEKSEVLRSACTGRDGQRRERKVQNPRLRQLAVVRS